LLRRKGFERFTGFNIGKELEVVPSDYYNFEYAKANNDVCFEYPESINGGSYYEYR